MKTRAHPLGKIGRVRCGMIAVVCATTMLGHPQLNPTSGRAVGGEMFFPGEDWAVADPEEEHVDSVKLRAAIEYLEEHSGSDGVRELVILRNGRMIHEGDNIDKVHGVWSCTKSFTSTVLGLLIEDGKCTLDTKAASVLPEMKAAYPDVTLRHFTTMTSGYRAKNDEPRGGYLHGPSPTPFLPAAEPLFAPGTKYAYWDSAMNQFGHVLTGIAEEPLEALFRRRIAEPIGMDAKQWNWGEFRQEDGPTVNGGAGNFGGFMRISARQMARFGHLFLNRGRWNSQQLICESWVQAATSTQVAATMPLGHPESGIDGRGVYGFNWWTNGIQTDGRRKWPGAPTGTFAASGFNNNDLFVIPEWNLVVVRLGLDQRDREITDEVYGRFLALIGSALSGGPDKARSGHE